MTNYIIRDMVSGNLVGGMFSSSPFSWHGGAGECRTKIAAGLTLTDDNGAVIQKVYAVEDQESGSGSDVAYGTPTYNAGNDTVTRSVTRSQTQGDIDFTATAWVRGRKAGYVTSVLASKGYDNFGDPIDAIGFILDAVIAELAARGPSATQEFANLLTTIAAVKAANPRP